MSDKPTISNQVFDLLEGTWTGNGRGEYPGIQSFDYRESFMLTRHDSLSLAYEQRTQKRYDGQTDWLVSHWESGFIRILKSGELEMVNAQSGGRTEVLVGKVETQGSVTQIRFATKVVTNDPRVLCTARMFELEGDILRYEMEMQTTAVEQLTHHLSMVLQRRA